MKELELKYASKQPFSFLSTGKVTSLVAKKDLPLATRIEEAIRKNESLEALTVDNVRRDIARARISEQKGKNNKLIKVTDQRNKGKTASVKSSNSRSKVASSSSRSKVASSQVSGQKTTGTKAGKTSSSAKPSRAVKISKVARPSSVSKSAKSSSNGRKQTQRKSSKLSVVGFRGRNSSLNKKVVDA